MPRPTNNSLLSLFKCNDLNQIVCYNENCDGKALYRHSANLERHLKKIHPFIYSSYIQKKKILKFPRKLNLEKRLIDLVRAYPILWNKFDENRLNEYLTNKAWNEISYKLEVTVHMCKKKWDNLLEKFRSEMNQISQPIFEIEKSSENWKSNLKYLSELLFLRDHIDLTKTAVDILPENRETIKLDYIKEESSESFTLFSETLEDSSQLEYGEESILQDDKEEQRLLDELKELTTQEQDKEEEVSKPLDDSAELRYANTQNDIKQSRRRHILDETDSEGDNIDEQPKQIKRKKIKLLSESDKSVTDESDSDKMFLLSLLPFLKSIPNRKKLSVRQRIQGVLLEEQDNS